MKVTVTDVMREMHNVFLGRKAPGTWKLEDGRLIPVEAELLPENMLLAGDWIALVGSRRNDGVYQVGEDGRLNGVRDETWDGTVWVLEPPSGFLRLCEEIAAWVEANPDDGVKRETFGTYSVERAVRTDGLSMNWRHVFAASLAVYRRMYWEEGVTC